MTANAFHPFSYDPFQQRSIDLIERDISLFIAAPTGSGKTVLADYVIERTLSQKQRVIYTAPIKTLSNQKFRDFSSRYDDRVGIMTGDVTINPTAPLVIMTTEIYRNTLLEDPSHLDHYAWIIFDEIHYLDDRERGTVWEEAILLTPDHMRLLCLSATIPNVAEIARWIREVHHRPIEVIEEFHRPVPLSVLFQCQNTIFKNTDDLKKGGYHERDSWPKVSSRRRPGHRYHRKNRHHFNKQQNTDHETLHPNRLSGLVKHLNDAQRLPCIYFTFGRRRTEDLAWEISNFSLISHQDHIKLRKLFDSLCDKFQLTGNRSIEALGHLIDRGVAYHHAGMLPTVKEVIERCFSSRLLKIIFTTETFALGVNMPARSIVLDSLKKRSDTGFDLLRCRDFQQMAGRAGRRGMDTEGFAYLRINPRHVSHHEIVRLINGNPESVHSRFNTAYATLLNLYRRYGLALLEIYPKTLYYFQTSGKRRQEGLELMQRKLELLRSGGYLSPTALTEKGKFASWLYGYELLLSELYTEGCLNDLDSNSLAILMTAIVYEPRPRTPSPKPHSLSKRLTHICQQPLAKIHKAEKLFNINPRTKAPAFHLSHAMDAWLRQEPFHRLTKLCDADEGEIVRYFRMSVQLLRQLVQTPAIDDKMHSTAQKAMRKINRDVIDAEVQLRMG